jgi:hypothetical protein
MVLKYWEAKQTRGAGAPGEENDAWVSTPVRPVRPLFQPRATWNDKLSHAGSERV